MLACEKSYLRNKIVDNVIKMVQGAHLIYEPILISSGNFHHKESNSEENKQHFNVNNVHKVLSMNHLVFVANSCQK
jgi:ornithine carbamoyltransferase